MGDQPGAGGSYSFKIRGHSRQRRSAKPYSRPSDRKKGVLESVKEFFSPSWLVDFWKGKITTEEEEIEEDENVDETENPTDTIERRPDPSRGSLELVNTRLSGEASPNTRENNEKIFGNGGLGSSMASAQIPSQTSRKSGLSAFLALTSRHQSNKETVVTRTTGSTSTNTESSRPLDQERTEASTGSVSDHIHLTNTKNEEESSPQVLSTREVSTRKDSESSGIPFVLSTGPSRKAMPSLFGTSTPLVGASSTPPGAPTSILSERTPIVSESRPQPISVFRNRPEFSIAAFGSPLPPQGSQSKRFSSPYYCGKTSFGGASSQFTKSTKRMRVASPSSLEPSRPIKKQIKPTPIAGPGAGGVASQTAKRILETLEKMSSPLVDAKKIPPSPPFSTSTSPLSFTSTRRKPPHQPNRAVGSPRKLQAKFGAPPVQSLSVPQRAAISRIHQKTQSTRTSTITTREPTSVGQVSSMETSKPTSTFTPTPLPMSLSPMESSKGGGKMKSAKSNTHYKSQFNTEDNDEVVNPLPEIVSAVPLTLPPSATLPSFSFSPSSTSKSLTNTTANTTATSTSKIDFTFVPPTSKQSDISSNNFKFSIPEQKVSSKQAPSSNQPSASNKTSYSFSLPAPVNKSDTSTMSDDVKNTTKPLLDKYKPAEGSWECSTCMINNKTSATSCVACSTPKPSKKIELPSNDLFKKFAPPSGSWSCETCLISNKPTEDKCIACSTPKPSSGKSNVPTLSTSDNLLKKFAPSQDSWECSCCMINNKSSDTKCVACQTPKPSSSQNINITVTASKSDELLKKFAPGKDSWECDTCLINNKGIVDKCVACQTPKPSSSQKPNLPVTTKSDDLLKKFAPSKDSWECNTCMINNEGSDGKCVACETPKPQAGSNSSSSTSQFTFGTADSLSKKFAPSSGSWTCDTCSIVNKPDSLKCLACESAKPGSTSAGAFKLTAGSTFTKSPFTFGSGSSGSDAKNTIQFGETSKSDSAGTSVPFKFGSSTVTTDSKPVVFGGPSDSQKTNSKDVGSPFKFGTSEASTSVTTKSDSTSIGFTFGSSAANSTSSKPAFQFGVTAVPKASDSPKTTEPSVGSGSSAVENVPKIQFGSSIKADEKKTSPFTFGASTPVVQFGSDSSVKENTPNASLTATKAKHSSIAQAAAAGLLQIPSSSPPVVDLTDDNTKTNQDEGSAPPNVNIFQQGTQPSNQMISTVANKSETPASTAKLPSLPFAFGAVSGTKPAEEPPKAVPPFSFMAGTSSAVASTAAPPASTASLFNFTSPLGSNNKILNNPTTVAPQFGSFATANTTLPGFPAVDAPTTTVATTTPFTFKATTNTNNKFGSVLGTGTVAAPGSGFSFGTPATNAASNTGGFTFGATTAVSSAVNASPATPFVFGSQGGSEQKSGFSFTAPNQPFAFGAGAVAGAPNAQESVIQTPSEESMDADGNNNSSQQTVPAFGSQPTPSATAFNFNAAPVNTGFNFGNTQTPSTFKFGASQPQVGSSPAVPSGLGAATVPNFGAPAIQGASGGFSFGSPATNNVNAQQPGFMGAGTGGAFTAGAGSGQCKRIIKKGVRRMKR